MFGLGIMPGEWDWMNQGRGQVLGRQPQAPVPSGQGFLGGLSGSSNALLGLGMGLLGGGRTAGDRWSRGLLGFQQGAALDKDRKDEKKRKEALEKLLKTTPLTPAQRAAIEMNPDIATEYMARSAFSGPGERRIIKGADGFNYYEDTGERVLPNVTAPRGGGDPFTLNPGQVRYDSQGNVIARGPGKASNLYNVGAGGTLVNERGEVLFQGPQKEKDAAVWRQKVEALVELGYPLDVATKIQSGAYQMDPNTGSVVDLTTGRFVMTGRHAGRQQPSTRPPSVPSPNASGLGLTGPTNKELPDYVPQTFKRGTGIGPLASDIVNNTIAQMIPQAFNKDVSEARAQLEQASRTIMNSIKLNPRFPVAEMERLESFVPKPNALQSAEDAVTAYQVFYDEIQNSIRRQQAILDNPSSSKKVGEEAEIAIRDLQAAQEKIESMFRVRIEDIPPKAQAALRANPQMREEFDRKYGPGASDLVLGTR